MNMPATPPTADEIAESVFIKGDLSHLTPGERARYHTAICKSLYFNPLTRPFEYITLNGKLVLYATKGAADQLRKINGISLEVISQQQSGDMFSVHVRATDKTGRTDEDFGVVSLTPSMKGEIRANAILKAITKAKRRVTLSISGLGFLDETEVEDLPTPIQHRRSDKPTPAIEVVDPQTGEIHEQSDGLISSDQLGELIDLADKVGADKRSYVNFLAKRWDIDVQSMAGIPADRFDDAKAQLQLKAERLDRLESKEPRGDAP